MTNTAIERQEYAATDEILTLSEAAAYLKLAERTIHRMIGRTEIPCARVGGQWRFMRSVLDDWLISRMQVLPRNELDPLLHSADGMVQLVPMIDPDLVVDPIDPGTPAAVLGQLIRPLVDRGAIRDSASFVASLLARERLSSTAFGNGVAVPHVRRPADNIEGLPPVVLGISREGVDFGMEDSGRLAPGAVLPAPDVSPVHFFFLLGTTSEVVHLRLLKRITLLFRDGSLCDALLTRDSTAELLAELASREDSLFQGESRANQ